MFMRAVVVVSFILVLAAPGIAQTPAPTAASDATYRTFEEELAFLRARNAKQYAINPVTGIDEASYVSIGGIQQWVTVRGQDRKNPVLLIVHGGPGDPTNPWTFMMFAPWEKYFTVVQWDQRGAGRTLARTGASIAPTMTIERIAQDGIELTRYLRDHLHKDKIVVVAHSFGTLIGLRMIRAQPELFSAYVGTGQAGDGTRNYAVAYDALLKKAESVNNQEAIDDLKRVGPPPYASGEGQSVQRKWANRFEGADAFLAGRLGLALVAPGPGSSIQDFNDSFEGQGAITQGLFDEAKRETPQSMGLTFAVPIFFFQGAEDFTTPTSLAQQYLAAIHSPHKEFVPIAGGGHFAMFMRSDEFLHELLERVMPLARAHPSTSSGS